MRTKLLFVFVCLLALSGCSPDYYHQKSCSIDYWGDNNYNVFGRKNCVGDTGKWVNTDGGIDGYYCTNPTCTHREKVTCKDTCCY